MPLVRRTARGAPNAVERRTLHRPSRVIHLATHLKQLGSAAGNMTRFSEMGVFASALYAPAAAPVKPARLGFPYLAGIASLVPKASRQHESLDCLHRREAHQYVQIEEVFLQF